MHMQRIERYPGGVTIIAQVRYELSAETLRLKRNPSGKPEGLCICSESSGTRKA